MNTSAKLLLLFSTALLSSCGASASDIENKKALKIQQVKTAQVLHQGISLGLEMVAEKPIGYYIASMKKSGNKPYQGMVIARSGKTYTAFCTVENIAGELFALPCDLEEAIKTAKGEQ